MEWTQEDFLEEARYIVEQAGYADVAVECDEELQAITATMADSDSAILGFSLGSIRENRGPWGVVENDPVPPDAMLEVLARLTAAFRNVRDGDFATSLAEELRLNDAFLWSVDKIEEGVLCKIGVYSVEGSFNTLVKLDFDRLRSCARRDSALLLARLVEAGYENAEYSGNEGERYAEIRVAAPRGSDIRWLDCWHQSDLLVTWLARRQKCVMLRALIPTWSQSTGRYNLPSS